MPAPTSYSEATLKTLMVEELGAVGVALGLTTASAPIVNAVYAVERLLGDAIADLTDMATLEAAARWQAWKAAEAAAVTQYDLSSDGSSLKRSQVFEHIQDRLKAAYGDWLTASAGSAASAFVFGTVPGARGW